MPLGRQVGFVFTGGNKGEDANETKQGNIAITLAHELGHGVYQIQHPWEQLNTQKTELSTNSWLMSYGQGIQLPYIHWEQISHPKFIIPIFKSDASGEMGAGKAKVKNDASGELEENVIEANKNTDPIGPGYYAATVNSRTIAFSARHPIAAFSIGIPSKGSTNISTNAVRFSTRIGLNENEQHEASQVNAFRHTLWQAEITKEFGADVAKELGNAHEENPFAATESNLKTSFTTLTKADETVDLLNNIIGRSIGTVNSNANMQELAIKTLDYYRDNGLWSAIAVTNRKGKVAGYTISQNKLGQEQYDTAKAIIQELDRNGFTKQEQQQRESITKDK